jgi:hypothetical protein
MADTKERLTEEATAIWGVCVFLRIMPRETHETQNTVLKPVTHRKYPGELWGTIYLIFSIN